MTRLVAIEEAFVTEEIAREWQGVLTSRECEPGFRKMGESILADTPGNTVLHRRLLDIGQGRIDHMDAVGIDVQVLSLTSPGVQVFKAALATRLAAEANDVLAAAVSSYPSRFAGLGAVAPQDPTEAAREIERIKKLGLHGLIINSHTFGEYLDQPKFAVILEAAEAATAGVTSAPALRLAIEVLGAERVLFAADYPYEDDAEAVTFMRSTPLNSRERGLLAHENADRLFGLK